ncbi:chromatin target of PRMT1 protein-like isoform X2 [Xyrichtys novacula]|nr:chromatin target of PRMT1 protein-like isoform X2 [Xyrichtys novacula]
MTMTFDPVLLQHRGHDDAPKMVLLVSRKQLMPLRLQLSLKKTGVSLLRMRRKKSVWTRLGWLRPTRRFSSGRARGFWSFMKKYRWKTRFTSTYRSEGNLCHRLGQRHYQTKRVIQRLTAGYTQPSMHLQRGGAKTLKRSGWNRTKPIPTRRQLDTELDKYMSLSKRRLDQQLDEYMSKSKSRLDADLDEYMSMAANMDLNWDGGGGDTDSILGEGNGDTDFTLD